MYNFDKITDRHNTGSYKWDSAENNDVIPLWVADMDFQTAPCVIEALRKRVEHGGVLATLLLIMNIMRRCAVGLSSIMIML